MIYALQPVFDFHWKTYERRRDDTSCKRYRSYLQVLSEDYLRLVKSPDTIDRQIRTHMFHLDVTALDLVCADTGCSLMRELLAVERSGQKWTDLQERAYFDMVYTRQLRGYWFQMWRLGATGRWALSTSHCRTMDEAAFGVRRGCEVVYGEVSSCRR